MKLSKSITALCVALSLCSVTSADNSEVLYDGKTELVVRDLTIGENPPIFTDKIKNALKVAEWKIGDYRKDMILPSKVPPETIEIMGEAKATEEEMLSFLLEKNPNPRLTCSPEELIHYYYTEGKTEGIRPDLALCQAMKETGFFKYGGDVLPEQNNYCGLGATGGGKRGATFASPQMGARAHIQHLKVYASKEPPKNEIVDPRYELVKQAHPDFFGNVPTWTGLNGRWAVPGTYYGQDIIKRLSYALSPKGIREELLKTKPDDFFGCAYLGIAYFNSGDIKKAIRNFDDALKHQKNWETYYDRALAYQKQGKRKKALEDYARAGELAPDNYEIWYNRGLIYFNSENYKKAIGDFERVLTLHPQIAEIAVYKAIAHIKLGEYEKAWSDFYKASQINTVNPIVEANRRVLEQCLNAK